MFDLAVAVSLICSVIFEIVIFPKENPRLLLIVAGSTFGITMFITAAIIYLCSMKKTIKK